ncbi:MAG: type I DNA topoisomerase [Patescibacteria group bacterium]
MELVIVESPTKAKTIARYLGKNYKVLASYGHVRDLPKSKIGVDVEHGFEPSYTVSADHKAKVKDLKTAAGKAKQVLFATDEDREGEAISWHIANILDIDPKKAKRITFHEITEDAIKDALANPRSLDLGLVDAQQARRILDRLVGYELSPFLWKYVRRGLSAGRVQSVALRIIAEREREIRAFVAQEYWSVEGLFKAPSNENTFEAKLNSLDGKTLDKLALKNQEAADAIIKEIEGNDFIIGSVESKEKNINPPAPFTTSTLQQDANKRLGFSAKQTMMLAQRLYEGLEVGTEGQVGLITYMRTDSVNMADKFVKEAAEYIEETFGKKYRLDEPRRYKTKSKGAQEAHEAIRPTDPSRNPDKLAAYLGKDELRLYELIWQRAMATQLPAAKLLGTSADLECGRASFRATGQRVIFDGYLKLYPDQDKDKFLPELKENEKVQALEIKGKQHFTEPPARYSDATLVKTLEESGIGRPSTYAPTISTLIERDYVERDDKKRLAPTDTGFEVNDLLVKHFPDIVDMDFTSRMESSLDHVAEGVMEWRPLLEAFYGPFHQHLKTKEKELDKELDAEAEGEVCEKCGSPMVVKRGRFGKFLACTNYPTCKSTKPLKGQEPPPAPEPTDEKCPACGAMMVKKTGRYGPFLSCSRYPECKTIKNIEKPVIDANGNTISCPKCKLGTIIERKSKKGKLFFSCNRYPECDQAFWDRPTGEKCPDCGYATLVLKGKSKISCPNDGCGFKRDAD